MGDRMRGITFAKQFPSAAEPLRGLFVADQVRATADAVDWAVIAPVPWAPPALGRPLRRPQPPREERLGAVHIYHPRYHALPRKMRYAAVAGAMARAARPAFEAVVAERRPGFVHAHALYPSGAAAAGLASAAGLPLVVTVHGSDLHANLADPAVRAQIERVVAGASRVVCVSTALARDLTREFGLASEAASVIPDCYDDETFTYTHHAVRAAGSGEPLALVSVGRLVPVKGYDLILEALATAVSRGRDARLCLIGSGPERAALASQAERLGIADRVEFAGTLSGAALAARLAAADAFVSSSRREGFGVALVEALACGLPVLATRSGGPEDIVAAADGVLCAASDSAALAAAIDDLAGRLGSFDRAGIASRARERYSRAAVGSRLAALYREVVDE